jgi:excisionase family DNA binding protein
MGRHGGDAMDDYMTTRDVAEAIGFSVRFVENRVREGTLRATAWDTGVRRVYRVKRSDLERFRFERLRAVSELQAARDALDEEV